MTIETTSWILGDQLTADRPALYGFDLRDTRVLLIRRATPKIT